ncbi:hypothetical protein [Halobaculum limi]|uniref:hypothetical protein n=1 Tax=Halobaculum limi TaxID=3031916 RepID=UPI00240523BB|nr:hypothetical protein [Halobaculum sp. YSMS11]
MREPLSRRDALRAVGAGGLAGLTALAGCTSSAGSDDTATATPTVTSAPSDDSAIQETNSIGMSCYTDEDDYFFRPDVVRVEPGTTLQFGVGTSCRQQTLAYHPDNDAPQRIPDGAESWSSPVMQGSMGGTFEVTLEVEGVYDYFGLHQEFGQVGSIVVGAPDPDGQPGLAPPQESIPEPARERLSELNDLVRSALSE